MKTAEALARRRELGRQLRKTFDRAAHAALSTPDAPDRDPLAVLEAAARGRQAGLLPLRHERMAGSPALPPHPVDPPSVMPRPRPCLSSPLARSLAVVALLALGAAAHAADTDKMLEQCRARAAKGVGAAPDGITLKYEGQRTDGTHAVNGAASVGGQERTFQCSFNKAGTKIAKFVVNKPAGAAASSQAVDEAAGKATERAAQGQFNATGKVPCAGSKSQPMGQCDFGVARAGGGTATVVVTRPDGRKRFLLFKQAKAIGADLSQADGNMKFRATKQGDLYRIDAGDERYEIPEAVISGG